MRKIESKMLNAICTGTSWSEDNTCVTFGARLNEDKKNYLVILHGNAIAAGYVGETPSQVSFCGWPSKTTLSRLRALGVNAKIQNREPHIDGKKVSPIGWIDVEPTSLCQ